MVVNPRTRERYLEGAASYKSLFWGQELHQLIGSCAFYSHQRPQKKVAGVESTETQLKRILGTKHGVGIHFQICSVEIWKQKLNELRKVLTFFAVQMVASKKSVVKNKSKSPKRLWQHTWNLRSRTEISISEFLLRGLLKVATRSNKVTATVIFC